MLKIENSDAGIKQGIHLVGGFLLYKVWTLFTGLFVLVSLVFAVTRAVKRGDVQGTSGVAAYTLCTCYLDDWVQRGIFRMIAPIFIASRCVYFTLASKYKMLSWRTSEYSIHTIILEQTGTG